MNGDQGWTHHPPWFWDTDIPANVPSRPTPQDGGPAAVGCRHWDGMRYCESQQKVHLYAYGWRCEYHAKHFNYGYRGGK